MFVSVIAFTKRWASVALLFIIRTTPSFCTSSLITSLCLFLWNPPSQPLKLKPVPLLQLNVSSSLNCTSCSAASISVSEKSITSIFWSIKLISSPFWHHSDHSRFTCLVVVLFCLVLYCRLLYKKRKKGKTNKLWRTKNGNFSQKEKRKLQ